jgi:signal transduction histidine kinase/DNA-binding response OmpR family regulator
MGMGLRRYDPTDGSIREYTNSPDDPSSLSSNSVNSVFEDSVGRIWVSTDRGGLCLYSYETDDFKSYSTREGLPDDVVYDVLEDSYGMLWFGTNRGLVKFDPESEKVLVYTREDGLLGNQFNYGAAVKDRNGKLWFGGVDGIISFLPKERVSRDFTPPMYITRLSINNIEQTPLAGGSPLRSSILFTDHITLEHKQSNIGIEFAAVHFSGNGTQDYLYRMDGLDDNWIELGSSNEVYYSQLAHGNYVLHVKAVNNSDGWESSAPPLSFVVRPPWWWSSLAKVVYLLTAIGITILVVHIVLRRRHRQMVEQQRLFETEKEKELYRSKINFFNEIAHEVRTPLTLINAPLEDVIEMNSDPKIDKNLKTISKNTRRLLELTHELLDFKNVDASKIRVEYRAVDILSLVVEVIERFEPSILKRGKTLLFDQGGNGFLATVDRDAVTKIMSNLLSNAMKYAASRISVSVYNNGNWFSIKVASDGEKIPVHLADRIFEPFYRMDTVSSIPGTGIGLSLSRSLAQIQKGNLFLDVNSEHKDNIFVLTLPIQAAGATTPPESADSSEQLLPDPETASVSTIDNGYKVLLAEDNNSLRDYLADRLRESCIVMTATNGVEALKILKTQSFDVVVSDIMMPEMDGMELCRRMKHDENLQYTPVVFLTARGDIQAKIDGLQEGAEAFVEKPFSFAYLRALIFSIMDNRKKEREAFAKLPFAPVSDIKINAADREFIDKVIDTIYKNITDENLNVESLADKMYMNRSSLLRKIKGISGISAVEFIKVVRLKEAAKMLGERRYQINEVCYAVGINSPSYFSKLFQQQFGMLPKEFERQSHRSAE